MTPTSKRPARLLTVSEVADILNTSVKTVYRRIKSSTLPVIRDGRSVRIHPEDLDRYIAARRSH